MTETDHTHLTSADVEEQPGPRPDWFRAYINNPNHTDEKGSRKPQLLGGGSKKHCEEVLREYRKKHFAATQWQAKIVPIDPDKLGISEFKVQFD